MRTDTSRFKIGDLFYYQGNKQDICKVLFTDKTGYTFLNLTHDRGRTYSHNHSEYSHILIVRSKLAKLFYT